MTAMPVFSRLVFYAVAAAAIAGVAMAPKAHVATAYPQDHAEALRFAHA